MTDPQLSELFNEGTAPERDAAFMLLVESGIGRARLRRRVLAVCVHLVVLLLLFVPVFVAGNFITPVLAPAVEGWPQFMGVPVPVALGGLVVALVLRSRLCLLPLRLGAIFAAR